MARKRRKPYVRLSQKEQDRRDRKIMELHLKQVPPRRIADEVEMSYSGVMASIKRTEAKIDALVAVDRDEMDFNRDINYVNRWETDKDSVRDGINVARVERNVAWIEKHCMVYMDGVGLVPLSLMPFQIQFMEQVYGRCDPDTG